MLTLLCLPSLSGDMTELSGFLPFQTPPTLFFHMVIIRRLAKSALLRKMRTLLWLHSQADFITLSGFLQLETSPSLSPTHMAIIRLLDKTSRAKMISTLRCIIPLLADFIVLSGLVLFKTSPIHMAIIRRPDKTSTAKMLTLLCLSSLADLIVLSGFLPLETPSF